jgi:hypothetical protein
MSIRSDQTRSNQVKPKESDRHPPSSIPTYSTAENKRLRFCSPGSSTATEVHTQGRQGIRDTITYLLDHGWHHTVTSSRGAYRADIEGIKDSRVSRISRISKVSSLSSRLLLLYSVLSGPPCSVLLLVHAGNTCVG